MDATKMATMNEAILGHIFEKNPALLVSTLVDVVEIAKKDESFTAEELCRHLEKFSPVPIW